MKLLELAKGYHPNIKSWISKAKTQTITHVTHVLHDESARDPKWFIDNRGSRLSQLVNEIFTLELKEVSNDTWTETDFEGRTHSDLVSQAIKEITTNIEPVYRMLRIQLISNQLKQKTTAIPTTTNASLQHTPSLEH